MYSTQNRSRNCSARDLHTARSCGTGQVGVYCRVRPMNEQERLMDSQSCLSIAGDRQSITLTLPTDKSAPSGASEFHFSHVFDQKAEQKEVYEVAAKPIVDSVLNGYNGTILAYGQTSSGKTYTMQGADIYDLDNQGLIPRTVSTIFQTI